MEACSHFAPILVMSKSRQRVNILLARFTAATEKLCRPSNKADYLHGRSFGCCRNKGLAFLFPSPVFVVILIHVRQMTRPIWLRVFSAISHETPDKRVRFSSAK